MTSGVFNPNLSGYSVPLKINNMKLAQLDNQEVISFKNHKRTWAKVLPKYSKTSYSEGDELIFDLKPSQVDFINISSSYLKISFSKPIDSAYLTYGTPGLIKKLQVLSGIYPIWDIDQYGKLLWSEYCGNLYQDHTKPEIGGFTQGNNVGKAGNTIFTGGSITDLLIPLVTPFDGLYLPVYNLGEPLTLRIILNTNTEALRSTVTDTALVGGYSLSEVSLMLDGLTILSGGEKESDIFQWHTHTPVYFQNYIPSIGQDDKKQFLYDMKNTSIKKLVSWYEKIPNTGNNINIAGAQSVGVTSHTVSMGGINYPYESGLQGQLEMYLEFERYFHRYDLFQTKEHYQYRYKDGWGAYPTQMRGRYNAHQVGDTVYTKMVVTDGVGIHPIDLAELWIGDMGDFPLTGKRIERDYPMTLYTMNFDKISQSSSIISGLDNERYSMIQTFTYTNAADLLNYRLHTWIWKDVVLQIINGKIVIND